MTVEQLISRLREMQMDDVVLVEYQEFHEIDIIEVMRTGNNNICYIIGD